MTVGSRVFALVLRFIQKNGRYASQAVVEYDLSSSFNFLGPLPIADAPYRTELSHAFVEAGKRIGEIYLGVYDRGFYKVFTVQRTCFLHGFLCSIMNICTYPLGEIVLKQLIFVNHMYDHM